MGFLDTLKSVFLDNGTGDGKSSIGNKILSIGSSVAGGLAAGREAGHAQEGVQNQQQMSALRDYENAVAQRGVLDLEQRKFAADQQNTSFRNALKSALTLNMKDASFNRPKGVPTISMSGGLRPSALGGDARAAAEMLNARALVSLMDGEKFADLPAIEKYAPTFSKPNALDTILGVAGTIGKATDRYGATEKQDEQSVFIRELMKKAAAEEAARQGASSPGGGGVPLGGGTLEF